MVKSNGKKFIIRTYVQAWSSFKEVLNKGEKTRKKTSKPNQNELRRLVSIPNNRSKFLKKHRDSS